MNRSGNRSLLGMYTIGIAALFLVGFLLILQHYKHSNSTSNRKPN